MSTYLTFEDENESYRKDSTIKLTMSPPVAPPVPEKSASRRVDPPVRTRAEEINKAYGTREPEAAARLRRRGGARQPKFRRIRPDVVTGTQRLASTRAAGTTTRTGAGSAGSMSQGGTGGGGGY